MSDQFTEYSTQGFFSRVGGSIVGALFGLVLLPVSVGLLYWNEGRAVEAIVALDRGAKQVVDVAADHVDPATEGKLVHVSGPTTVATSAKDPAFGITGHDLIRVARSVQMFQWKEEKHSESHESVGGSKTTETTYTYRPEWQSLAVNSSNFQHPVGHINPTMPVHSQSFNGTGVTLGAYRVGGAVLDLIEDFQPLAPDPSATLPEGYRREGDDLYRGTGTLENPAVGDVQISFTAIETQPISVVAALSGGTLTEFRDPSGYTIVLAQPGSASADALFQAKKHSEGNLTWILRGVGFVVMFVGFLLLGRPVSMLLAFLPFLEGIAETGVFLIALTLTLPLTLLTIAIAWFAHRPLISVGLVAAALILFVLFRRTHRRPVPAAAASIG